MTYLEAFLKEHPEINPDALVRDNCPDYREFHPDICYDAVRGDYSGCAVCWNREMPETSTPKKPSQADLEDFWNGEFKGPFMLDNRDAATETTEWPTENPHISDKAKQVISSYRHNPDDNEGPRVLDSGARREFGTGAVRDSNENKGRCDLLPLDVVATYLHNDMICNEIHMFQNSGDVNCLYRCLSHFEPHWGQSVESTEDLLLATVSTNYKRTTMLLETSKHFEEGGKKYGDDNWKMGMPVHVFIDSAVRHYLKFLRGDMDEPHDRAFCWNILCAIWTCKHKPELNKYENHTEY